MCVRGLGVKMSDRQKDGGISVDSEDLSQCSNYESVTKGSDGETECGEHSDCEGRREFQPLDSADEEHVDVDDNENDQDSDSDSVIVEDEREDGDGQESAPAREKKLDDDEDRRNPQYIPKKGTFYEHDDRTADDGEPGKEREGKEGGKDREGKEAGKESSGRKIWKEKEDRWKHDRFQETEQMPKSREELLQVYGYDIRSEESPPKARRRRRYGRGPNKYTRSWEDEAAYGRQLGAFIDKEAGGDAALTSSTATSAARKKGPPSRGGQGRPPRRDRPRQDFPALTPPVENAPTENGQKAKSEQVATKVGGDSRVAGSFKMNPRDVIPPFRNINQDKATSNNRSAATNDEGNKRSWRREDGEESRQRQGSGGRMESRPRPPTRGRGARLGRGGGDRIGRPGRPGENGHQSDGASQNDVIKEMASLTINNCQHQQDDGVNSGAPNNGAGAASNNYRQAVVPPRMQQESAASRPKRYSSVRPRNMPEAGPVPVPVAQSPPMGPTVPVTVPVTVPGAGTGATPPVTASFTAPAHSYFQPGYGQALYAENQQPVPNQVVVEASGAAQLMVRPPQAVPPPPFPAAFAQPPPTYMTPPPGPAARLLPAAGYMAPPAAPPPQPINFVAAPTAQGQFQSLAFQTYQPIAMVSQVNQPQPQEMYQRQSGITYYSPQNQAMPRAVPQPRVKAAIPIVPPPELASRHRDELEMSGEHDPAALSHSPSPGGIPVGAPLEASDLSPSPAPAPAPAQAAPQETPQATQETHEAAPQATPQDYPVEAPPKSASPSGAPSQGLLNEQVALVAADGVTGESCADREAPSKEPGVQQPA